MIHSQANSRQHRWPAKGSGHAHRASPSSIRQLTFIVLNIFMVIALFFLWSSPDRFFQTILQTQTQSSHSSPVDHADFRGLKLPPHNAMKLGSSVSAPTINVINSIISMTERPTSAKISSAQSSPLPSALPKVNYLQNVPRFVRTEQAAPSPPSLLSLHRPVRSDVRGNLGPASVVTNESVASWLTDRWQAAKNMRGEPIPGEHWLEIDLQRPCEIQWMLIDWETAYSENYQIQGSNDQQQWNQITSSKLITSVDRKKQHVIHKIEIPLSNRSATYRYIRLLIHASATNWGSSVWRAQVWGIEKKTAV